MVHKIFLDANVILDFTLKRPGAYNPAKSVFEKIVTGDCIGSTSSIVIHIVNHIMRKELGSRKSAKIILAMLNDIEVIDTPREIIEQAMNSGWNDTEDALQYHTALHHKSDILISRDKDFMKKALPNLPIISPTAFLEFS